MHFGQRGFVVVRLEGEAIALTVAVVVYVRYKCLVILVEIEVRSFVEDDKRLVLFGNEAVGSAVIVCAELYAVASAAFQCQLVVDILHTCLFVEGSGEGGLHGLAFCTDYFYIFTESYCFLG